MRVQKVYSSLSRRFFSIRSTDEVRQSFVDYFKGHGHEHLPSSSLIPPKTDESLLFTNAGMNQFKPILEGKANSIPYPRRVVTHQKCIRAGGKLNDLEDVGRDLHHLSFFEMLGNWSFNNAYSKEEACKLAWNYLTGVLNIPASRLYITYFGGDTTLRIPADEDTRRIWAQIGFMPI